MYYDGKEYDNMANLVIEIYLDYNFNSFPIDEKLVCNKLGLNLVPYSAFEYDEYDILKKKSKDAFLVMPYTTNDKATIYYNDDLNDTPYTRTRYSIFHEVKHYVNNDKYEDEKIESMADYFAKYFMCPIPYLVYNNINTVDEIISMFNVSMTVARYVLKNIENRRLKYGNEIFEKEKPLMQLLCKNFN